MQAAHIPVVYPMLKKYLEQFKLAPHFSEAEFRHYFTTQDKVVYSYVVEDPATKQPTDFVSFYSLPSTVINHPLHKTLNVAYSYYYATTKTPLTDLMRDCLIEAKKVGVPIESKTKNSRSVPKISLSSVCRRSLMSSTASL